MSFDGSLVFDTQIDSGSTRKELAELQQEFYDVNSAMKSQIRTIKDLEQYYKELEEASKNAIHPQLIEELNRELTETGLKLQDARKKLIELRVQSNGMKDTLKEFTQSTQTTGKSLTSLGKRILGLARRVFVFSVVLRAFHSLQNLIAEAVPGVADLENSFNELKIAIVRAVASLSSFFVPAIKATIEYVVELVNTIREAITSLMKLFGQDVADDAEVTKKATEALAGGIGKLGKAGKKANKDLAQFDEIIKIGTQNASDLNASAKSMNKTGKAASDASKKTDKLKKSLKKLVPYALGALLGGKKGLGIAGIIDGIGQAIKANKKAIEDGIDWDNIAENAESSFKIIGGATLVGGKKAGGIVGILKSIADEVVTFNDVTKNGVNWKNLTKNATDTIELFASAAMLGGATGGKKGAAKAVGIAAVIQGIADSVAAHADMFNKGLNWKNLTLNAKGSLELIGGMAGLGMIYGKTKAATRWAGAAATIKGIADAIKAAKSKFSEGIKWENLVLDAQSSLEIIGGMAGLGYSIGGKMKAAKWAGVAAIIKGIAGVITNVRSTFKNGLSWSALVDGALNAVQIIMGAAGVGGKDNWKQWAGVASTLVGVSGAIQTATSQFKEGLTWANTVKGAESAILMFMGAAGAQNTQFAPWVGVAATIGGIVGAIKGAKSIFDEGLDWQNLVAFLPNAITSLTNLLTLLNGESLKDNLASGATASLGIVALLNGVRDIMDDIENKEDGWTTALDAISTGFGALATTLALLGNPTLGAIALVASGITKLIKKFKTSKTQSETATKGIKQSWETLNSDEKFDPGAVIETKVTEHVKNAETANTETVTTIDTAWNSFDNTFDKDADERKASYNASVKSMENTNKEATDKISTQWDSVHNKFTATMSEITKDYDKDVQTLKGIIANILGDPDLTESEKLEKAQPWIERLMTKYEEGMKNVTVQYARATTGLLNNTQETMKSINGKGEQEAAGMLKTLLSNMDEYKGKYSKKRDEINKIAKAKTEAALAEQKNLTLKAFKELFSTDENNQIIKDGKKFNDYYVEFQNKWGKAAADAFQLAYWQEFQKKLEENVKKQKNPLKSVMPTTEANRFAPLSVNTVAVAPNPTGLTPEGLTALSRLTLPSTGLAMGAVVPVGRNSGYVVNSAQGIEKTLRNLVRTFEQALANQNVGNSAVMQVDGTTFAQLVYQYNTAETARVGVNLLSKE